MQTTEERLINLEYRLGILERAHGAFLPYLARFQEESRNLEERMDTMEKVQGTMLPLLARCLNGNEAVSLACTRMADLQLQTLDTMLEQIAHLEKALA